MNYKDVKRYRDEIQGAIETIAAEFSIFTRQISDIRRRMRELENAGMYDAVPTESWETRGDGEYEYLYMIFPKRDGLYTGPGYRRKLYIGNKPENMDEARRMKRNRQEYEELAEALEALKKWQMMMRLRVLGVAMMAEERPDLELPADQGRKFQQWARKQQAEANG